ncbi:MAG TPA: hypothetical protein VML53_03385 [Thermoplasmata archaeon]|nr:hypothetical protein [Thermoplasmata archaeon]
MDPALVLWPVAVAMSAIIAALVRWTAETRTVVAASIAVFLLVMMAAMFVGTEIYFAAPDPRSLVLGLWVAAAIMSASVFPVFALILREARAHAEHGPAYRPRRLRSPTLLALSVAVLVLASEMLMGRSFALADGSPASGELLAVLVATLASPWFLLPMGFEMGLTIVWLAPRFPPAAVAALGAQGAMMIASPPAFANPEWWIGSGVATAVAMSTFLAYVLWAAYRGVAFPRTTRHLLVRVLVATAVAGAGLALWSAGAGLAVFGLSTVLQMGVFFTAAVAPEEYGVPPTGTADRPPGAG